jgi:hypothetical protein
VRYEARVEEATAHVCHCRDCQRFTGTAFASLVIVPKEALTINGAMKTFSSPGGSGQPVLRHFCPECGSSLMEEVPIRRPGVLVLNVGTFDNPAQVTLTREIFCDDAWSWVALSGDRQRFARGFG